MDGLELWHESVARATLHSNGYIGHLHGLLGMVGCLEVNEVKAFVLSVSVAA